MSPPELAGNAPVTDVVHPIIVRLSISFGNKANSSAFNRLNGGFRKILYGNEPLLGDHGFDSCAAAIACADVVAVGLDFNQCAALPEIFNKYFAAFFGCKSGIFSAEFVDMPVFREHTHAGESRALTDFKIVRIMTRSDFNGAGAEVHFNIFIRNYGNFPANDGHNNGFADNFRIARVIGVNGYACVAEDGFRAGRCADDGIAAVRRIIANMPKIAGLFNKINLRIGNRRFAVRTPVDDAVAAVNQTFFI